MCGIIYVAGTDPAANQPQQLEGITPERVFMWAEEIKAMRTAAKQTQAQAAEFLRVSKRSIESWETGKREPKEHTKNGIREIYNFYYGDGQHPEREPEPQRVTEPEPVKQAATQETTQRKEAMRERIKIDTISDREPEDYEVDLSCIGYDLDYAIKTKNRSIMEEAMEELFQIEQRIARIIEKLS